VHMSVTADRGRRTEDWIHDEVSTRHRRTRGPRGPRPANDRSSHKPGQRSRDRTASVMVTSVNVGRARTILSAIVLRTGIWKSPVEGRVRVAGVNVQATVRPTDPSRRSRQAVYAYASEDLAWWANELLPARAGAFGENLTTAGIDFAEAVTASAGSSNGRPRSHPATDPASSSIRMGIQGSAALRQGGATRGVFPYREARTIAAGDGSPCSPPRVTM
jgi:hypothetical protein